MRESDNPKNLLARDRVKLAYIPPVATAHMAHALMDGGSKYNPFNWREKSIALMEYISAAKRHLDDFQDGENCAEDSLCHHLGHAMACCAIMLDAIERKNEIDDRPPPGNVSKVFKQIEAKFAEVKARREHAARTASGKPLNVAGVRRGTRSNHKKHG